MRLISALIGLLLGSVAFWLSPDVVAQEPAATPGITRDASPATVTTPADLPAPAEYVAEITLAIGPFPSASAGVAVDDNGTLYVIDSLHDQIQVFDRDGNAVATWGETGSAPGQFKFHTGGGYWGDLAFGPDGNLYVMDPFNSRIQVLAPDGAFLRAWGERGSEEGQLNKPGGIAIDGAGRVYVAESGNKRVQVFDSDGQFLAAWALPVAAGGPFREAADVAVDAVGNVYVTDLSHARVYRFDANGSVVGSFGGFGVKPGQIVSPWGVAVDAQGNVYVAEYGANRVQIFAPDGTSLGVMGRFGEDPGQYYGPIFLTVGPDGLLYVADEGNRRVQIFRLLPPLGPTTGTPAP